ncbi:hypothetical protein GOV06_01510 [Candidatus Woesearchaeota archaeon]|nr:hypothetical protein [Candidatus Woesearchaeota archaeon]
MTKEESLEEQLRKIKPAPAPKEPLEESLGKIEKEAKQKPKKPGVSKDKIDELNNITKLLAGYTHRLENLDVPFEYLANKDQKITEAVQSGNQLIKGYSFDKGIVGEYARNRTALIKRLVELDELKRFTPKEDSSPKDIEKPKKSTGKKIILGLAGILAAYLGYSTLSNSDIEYFRQRRIDRYHQTMQQIEEDTNSKKYRNADKSSEDIQTRLKKEKHSSFASLRERIIKFDNEKIDPHIKRLDYITEFDDIQKEISQKKYENIHKRIQRLAVKIEKDTFPKDDELLDTLRNFTYDKLVLVPNKIERKQVMGGIDQKVWENPVYEHKRISLLNPMTKKILVKEGRYRKIGHIPPIYENFLISAHHRKVQATPFSGKEVIIGTIPIKKEQLNYSSLEKEIMEKWSLDIPFEFDCFGGITEDKQVNIKKSLPIKIGNHHVNLDMRSSESLHIYIENSKTLTNYVTLGAFIGAERDGLNKDRRARNIGFKYNFKNNSEIFLEYDNNFLDLVSKTSEGNGIACYDFRLDSGDLLRIVLQIESWGVEDNHRVGYRINGSPYNYRPKMSGKVRVSIGTESALGANPTVK